VISGRLVKISSPVTGTLQDLYVHDGDRVTQGQLLATVESAELRHKYESLKEDLAIESANLTANLARLKLDFAFRLDNSHGTLVALAETLATLAAEEARLVEYESNFQRREKLLAAQTVSEEEYVQHRTLYEGQQAKVSRLQESLDLLKARTRELQQLGDNDKILELWQDQLKPYLTRIEGLQSHIFRHREMLKACQIVAPVNGVVATRHGYSGEACNPTSPLFTLLEENSLGVVLYVPQESITEFPSDRQLSVIVAPNWDPVFCTVDHPGNSFLQPPDSIKRYYHAGQHLLPVYCSIDERQGLKLPYGATVKVPYL
jgi:multidrug resistance efflux pump